MSDVAFSDLGTVTIPAGTKSFHSAGYASASTLGAAWYDEDPNQSTWGAYGSALRTAALNSGKTNAAAVDAALAVTMSRFRRADASGRYFTLRRLEPIVAEMFGAVGDAVYTTTNNWDNRWAGTDNSPAFQSMFDWSYLFGGNTKVGAGNGLFLFATPVQCGYGDRPIALEFEGAGEGYRSFLRYGTCLCRNFCGQPLINIQYARHVRFRKFRTFGVNWEYFRSAGLAVNHVTPTADDRIASSWCQPEIEDALGRSADDQYSADAAITIDARCGLPPPTPYAPIDYPAYLASTGFDLTQYGTATHIKGQSSDVIINEISFFGEINGCILQPCNFEGNGDFCRIYDVSAETCKRIYSIGGNQSRASALRYAVGGQLYEFISTTTHGKQNGQVSSELSHLTASGLIQIFSFGSMSVGGSVALNELYIEAGYMIGTVTGGALTEPAIQFNSCLMNLGLQGLNARGIPAVILGAPTGVATTLTPVTFNGGFLEPASPVMINAHVTIHGGTLITNEMTGPTAKGADPVTGLPTPNIAPELAAVQNATSGGLVTAAALLSGTQRPPAFHPRFTLRNLDTGLVTSTVQVAESFKSASRVNCIPFMAASVSPSRDAIGIDRILNPPRIIGFPKSTISNSVITKFADRIEWTFNVANYIAGNGHRLELDGGAKGDVWVDADTLMMWVQTNAPGNTPAHFVLRSLNNIQIIGTPPQAEFIVRPNFDVGTMRVINSRRYTPPLPMFGATNAVDGAVIGVGQDNGAKLAANDVQVGDRIYVDPSRDNWITDSNSRITAIDLAAGTMSLAGSSLKAGARRFPLMVRTIV